MKKNILIVVLLLLLGFGGFVFVNQEQTKRKEAELLQLKLDKFNTHVITNKKTTLYDLEDDTFIAVGYLKEGYPLNLSEQEITKDTTHFKTQGLNYYVAIDDLDKTESPHLKKQRYQDYIVFNENVKTLETTVFYDEHDNEIASINQSFDLPIYIKDTPKYGVVFDDTLVYVKDIESTYAHKNTDEVSRKNLRTFTYHTVYDTKTQKCASVQICHPIEQFEEQLQYLKEHKFVTLTMEEVEMFLDNKIRIPIKTVALTLDDGIFLENSVPLVEKYEMYATFFIITSRTDVSEYLNASYARFESHTDDLHNNYRCPLNTSYSQGGQMMCEKYERVIKDLRLSQEKLNGSYYFAYPFFDVNDQAIRALKETGFHLAFVGQLGTNGYSDSTTEKMRIRRKTIFGNDSIKVFADYVNDRD